jgi:hypothetical protein
MKIKNAWCCKGHWAFLIKIKLKIMNTIITILSTLVALEVIKCVKKHVKIEVVKSDDDEQFHELLKQRYELQCELNKFVTKIENHGGYFYMDNTYHYAVFSCELPLIIIDELGVESESFTEENTETGSKFFKYRKRH